MKVLLILAATVHFSHKIHDDAQGFERYKCSHCHQLDAGREFKPLPPGRDAHKPCSDSACHGPRLDLVKIEGGGSICSTCHEDATRFGTKGKPARLVLPPKSEFEFGWHFNHKKHLEMERFKQAPQAVQCDPCHKQTPIKRQDPETKVELLSAVEHEPDHSDCHECHQPGKSSPQLTECQGCHIPGQKAPHPEPNGGGVGGKWRVMDAEQHSGDPRALFHHDKHRFDPRTAKKTGGGTGWSRFDKQTARLTGCGVCHNTAWQAARIADMKLLEDCAMKKSCLMQCHDGEHASRGTPEEQCLPCHKPMPTQIPMGKCG
jgi:hypothetical protein